MDEEEDEEEEEEEEDEDEDEEEEGPHPLKWGHREGEPWSEKLLRSRLASRLLSLVPIRLLSLHPPGFFPYTHLPSFPSGAYPRPQ